LILNDSKRFQAFLTLQSINVFTERKHIARFNAATLAAISCAPVAADLAIINVHLRSLDTDAKNPIFWLEISQAVLLVLTFIGFVTIQRRPVVFYREKLVDGQYTTSLLGRYTFSWPFERLRYARLNKKLKIEEIPALADVNRSQTLLSNFQKSRMFSRLWMRTLWFFRTSLIESTVFIAVAGVLQFVPQYAMYCILKLMEAKNVGSPIASEGYFWVFAFGFSMIVSTFIETWLFWIVEAHLGIPARATLSALIFEKATRRKNVQGGQKKKTVTLAAALETTEESGVVVNEGSGTDPSPKNNETTPVNTGTDTVVVPGKDKKEKKTEEGDEEEQKKTRQGVINLIAVDTQRFQFFLTYFYFYPNFIVKIVVSMAFLLNIIGPIPLLAGLAAIAVIIPFNIFCSKRYTGQVNKLMKTRDEKLEVVTEALQGVRQIKYSAIEQKWQDRIQSKRAEELRSQRRAFYLDLGLLACWIGGKHSLPKKYDLT
jgi:hypothetical protein